MPLKHATETLLVLLLGVSILIAGFAAAVLPALPAGLAWWLLAALAAAAYPLALYPLLKSRRADYPFRALHFAPLGILLVRFILDLLGSLLPVLRPLAFVWSWGWTLAGVFLFFVLLAVFCLQVLRQRSFRLRLLGAMLVPFALLGVVGEYFSWDDTIAGVLGERQTVAVYTGSGSIAANLEPSDDPDEEQWRMQLRRMERRSARIDARHLSGSALLSSSSRGTGAIAMISSTAGSASSSRPVTGPPPRLPSSGTGLEGLLGLFATGYFATLHERARRRKKAN